MAIIENSKLDRLVRRKNFLWQERKVRLYLSGTSRAHGDLSAQFLNMHIYKHSDACGGNADRLNPIPPMRIRVTAHPRSV